MSSFTVEKEGLGWIVCKNGVKVTGAVSNRWWAEEKRDALERDARRKLRSCLRCRDPFLSEGPHHRMCIRCRQAVSTMYEGAV